MTYATIFQKDMIDIAIGVHTIQLHVGVAPRLNSEAVTAPV